MGHSARVLKIAGMTSAALRVSLVAGSLLALCLVALFVASAINWRAADQKCGSLFAFDPRFADAHEVSMETAGSPYLSTAISTTA